jgi:hypothetical protein
LLVQPIEKIIIKIKIKIKINKREGVDIGKKKFL